MRIAGSSNSTAAAGGSLASIAVAVSNVGDISITPPWQLDLTGNGYLTIAQSFGLQQARVTGQGVSAVAADTWDVLWPQSTNRVTLGLVLSTSASDPTPTAVKPHTRSSRTCIVPPRHLQPVVLKGGAGLPNLCYRAGSSSLHGKLGISSPTSWTDWCGSQ